MVRTRPRNGNMGFFVKSEISRVTTPFSFGVISSSLQVGQKSQFNEPCGL